MAIALLSLSAADLHAQAPIAPATPAPTASQAPTGEGGGAVVIEQDVSGHYFEWGVTLVGVAAAVYVVCRSSRRN